MAQGASRPTPKPGPVSTQRRWFQERKSEYAWEQEGLDHVRRLMPNAEPYRAWTTFSFTAASGRVNECDLLIAVPGGLYLVELKGHPGHAVNNGDTWTFRQEGSRRMLTLRNPLHLIDLKSKELKSRLKWAAGQLGIETRKVPFVEPAIFLSAAGLRSDLDEVQRARVYGRDEKCDGLPWVWRDLLNKPPERESRRVTAEFSRDILPKLLDKIGIRVSTSHLRFGDDWSLGPEPLDAGRTWEDRLAERRGIVREEGRVRIYLTERQATDEAKQSVERAARREYQVLQGIAHRGIAQAVEIKTHQGGPAILFRHRAADLRLDSYLAVYEDVLTPELRLELVRQLAEALRYAHSRSLYHRALAARSVYVSAKEDGSAPVLRIIDWQAAARDFDTAGLSSIGHTSLTGEHLADTAEVYLAPEFDVPHADPVDLDVFGLGAVAYLILTGQPPAGLRSGLIERLIAEGGLHAYAVSDGISDLLDDLVFQATRNDLGHRLPSAEAFLDLLDNVEQDAPAQEPSAPDVDPLIAVPGQFVDGDWSVRRVLGTGATARALLVERVIEDEDGDEQLKQHVLKVALDEDKAERLRSEARALELVGGGVVVKLLDGPRTLADRTVLDLEYAGDQTLGARLRAEGKLTYHELARFGGNLFTALDQLAGKGVRHRDLKPDNFGVLRRADRSWQLMLFDFSLHEVSERDVKAGTRGYLDPFLGTARRPVFDDHAERYAAAVTLHEMASTARPVWGDGVTDPRTTQDETPAIATELFEPALQDGLTRFFRRAFHRDVDSRFDTFRQMEQAWQAVFAVADASAPASTPATVGLDAKTVEESRDAHADAAKLRTPLDAAGLSPRAVSVAQAFGATTVGELLDVKLHEIAKARGAGAVIRKELNRRHKQWTAALRHDRQSQAAGPAAPEPAESVDVEIADTVFTVDELAALLMPVTSRKDTKKSRTVRLALGLPNGDGPPEPWLPQSKVAKAVDLTQASVSRHLREAAERWASTPWLEGVRNELVDTLTEAGRVMTAQELASAFRARHGADEDSAERTMAKALAVVRAAVEAEIWAGLHAEDAEGDGGPRLAVLRRGEHTLLALESLPGTDDPSAPELADYAHALGSKADTLAGEDPLPGRVVVLRELRLVTHPDGLDPLADTRLVSLAASASDTAAASPRLELYPRGLDLAKALRISQAAAGVRRDIGITVDDLLSKVRARFPGVAAGERPTHVRVEEALKAAGFSLEYDPADRRFRPPAPEFTRLSTSSGITASTHGRMSAAGLDPQAVLQGKLTRAVEHGGFSALTLRGRNLSGSATAIASAYQVTPVDLNREFLTEFRALAAEHGTDWNKVLTIDARFGENGKISRGLASYVRTAWTRLEQRLLAQSAQGKTVLFVHDAGLLARYFDEGGHALLTRLQNAARRPADVPHGFWLLCPGESEKDSPQLDGQIVEVLGESERVVLSGTFLAELKGDSGAA